MDAVRRKVDLLTVQLDRGAAPGCSTGCSIFAMRIGGASTASRSALTSGRRRPRRSAGPLLSRARGRCCGSGCSERWLPGSRSVSNVSRSSGWRSSPAGRSAWGSNEVVYRHVDQPITLAQTSPSYALRCARTERQRARISRFRRPLSGAIRPETDVGGFAGVGRKPGHISEPQSSAFYLQRVLSTGNLVSPRSAFDGPPRWHTSKPHGPIR